MVGAPKALAGSSPVADPGSGFQQALVNLLSPILKGLRRMQEELHFNLRVPGSNPGCAFGAVAQRIEHQTPFAGVVSPIVVAAGPAGKVYCLAGECRREYIGPNGVSTPWKNSLQFLSPARGRVRRMPKELHKSSVRTRAALLVEGSSSVDSVRLLRLWAW